MPRTPKPPVFAFVVCHHCNTPHTDRNTPDFPFAEKNHSMHLCLKADGGCGRRFFTKSNIGVAADDPRLQQVRKDLELLESEGYGMHPEAEAKRVQLGLPLLHPKVHPTPHKGCPYCNIKEADR